MSLGINDLAQSKDFHDAEAEVIGHEPGKGDIKDDWGRCRFVYPTEKSFRLGQGFRINNANRHHLLVRSLRFDIKN